MISDSMAKELFVCLCESSLGSLIAYVLIRYAFTLTCTADKLRRSTDKKPQLKMAQHIGKAEEKKRKINVRKMFSFLPRAYTSAIAESWIFLHWS